MDDTKSQFLIDPAGLWTEMGIDISEEDIAEVRQEMWGNFPREIKQLWDDYLLNSDDETKM
jgi:hypothetical protein